MKCHSMIVRVLCLMLLVAVPCLAGQTLTAAVDEDIIADYQLFVGERDPLDIIHFSGPGARRDVVEIVLLQQALGGPRGRQGGAHSRNSSKGPCCWAPTRWPASIRA